MKYSKIIISSALAATLFTSCKKLLDIEDQDFIGGDVALQTVENNEQSVIGAYAAMQQEMQILFNAVVSDEVRVGEFYNSATVHEWQYTSTDITIRDNFTASDPFYRVIDRANRVLQAVDNADSTRVGDNTLRTRLKAEAQFIRAWSHFELYRFYSNTADPNALAMVYRKVPSLQPAARITVQEYFTELKADMNAAKPNLPNTLTRPAINRATRTAVSGLQARVALYLREWADANTFATEYINAKPLATPAQFAQIWTDQSDAELAFVLDRTNQVGGRIGNLFRATSASASNIGTVTWLPSNKLLGSYDQTNDIRYAAYFRTEPLLAAVNRPSTLIKKYEGNVTYPAGYGNPDENVADAKVFRTGEMYLIRAEARAELNDLVGAAADLNALRAARITGYVPEVFANKDAIITAVINERYKELAYEGHRFFDLRRRNLPVQRLASDAPNAQAQTLPAGNFRFILPIPNSEIQANPLIQQNPGYLN